jgi:hypothetical protein
MSQLIIQTSYQYRLQFQQAFFRNISEEIMSLGKPALLKINDPEIFTLQ